MPFAILIYINNLDLLSSCILCLLATYGKHIRMNIFEYVEIIIGYNILYSIIE